MRFTIPILLGCWLTLSSLDVSFASTNAPVTNEEIHGAIMSLVYSYHVLENKLERHEHREKTWGESFKRSLQNLQKGQKAYEPMKGVFERLDERVNQVETMLINQEDKHNAQAEKLDEVLSQMVKWMNENSACKCDKPVPILPMAPMASKIDTSKIEANIAQLTKNIENLEKTTRTLMGQAEQVISSKLENTDEVILKLEDKISHYYVTSPAASVTSPSPPPAPIVVNNLEFENKVVANLDNISKSLSAIKELSSAVKDLSVHDKIFLEDLNKQTLSGLQDIKSKVAEVSSKVSVVAPRSSFGTFEDCEYLNQSLAEISKQLQERNHMTEKPSDKPNASCDQSSSSKNLEALKNFENLLTKTSEGILDTQRKVEYGVRQTILEVRDMLSEKAGSLNDTIQKRFDQLEGSQVANHFETIHNISNTFSHDMESLWRQFEMQRAAIDATNAELRQLNGQTDVFFNGTVTSLNGLIGKISNISSSVQQFGEDLNFLSGRLSLTATEFKNIKKALSVTLDDIRNGFKEVQDKANELKGPGPHKIANEEEEEEV